MHYIYFNFSFVVVLETFNKLPQMGGTARPPIKPYAAMDHAHFLFRFITQTQETSA